MILVVSYPGEEHSMEVMRRLTAAGTPCVLMDLGDFPARNAVALSWPSGDGGAAARVVRMHDGTSLDLRDVRAGWWRRVRPHLVDGRVREPHARAFAQSETSQAIGGMLGGIDRPWMNERGRDELAQHKPWQWSVAQEAGLRLPRTLVTTSPQAARAFVEEVGVGRTVFKAFLASQEAWRETRLVRNEDLARLESVRLAPVIFQEYVDGVDLRVTIVGDRVYAAELDARATSYPVDMRMVVGEARVRAVTLPWDVESRLRELQARLGLVYGAHDLRRTPEGEHVFFEVNSAGQWLFVESRTGLPISQGVADHLAAMAAA